MKFSTLPPKAFFAVIDEANGTFTPYRKVGDKIQPMYVSCEKGLIGNHRITSADIPADAKVYQLAGIAPGQ